MTAKIIDANGHVHYDDKNHDKLMAYYKLNDFFLNHAIGHFIRPITFGSPFQNMTRNSFIRISVMRNGC